MKKKQHTQKKARVELEVRRVFKDFVESKKRARALDSVSFSVHEHEFVCIVGPSGCGKSTLLRMIAGLEFPSKGDVLFRGKRVGGPDPKTSAMIFQTFALLPWRNVYENISLGLESIGTPIERRPSIINKYIKLMDLEDFSDAYPFELSGGMKQRVGIARALAVEPRMLLMDEPFSALDALTAENLRRDVLEIWSDPRTPTNTFVMITHLIDEAVFMADRVIVLSRRPGKVIADIHVDVERPRVDHARDPEFFEMCDMIKRMISYHSGGTIPEPDTP
ncbi:ABC transporter ATP-binding protein [Candidatus Micrarchaeota archaeon]|nr:ABC transporter ATP-binding protein [Candidatus Micrarchaeota archaeon]